MAHMNIAADIIKRIGAAELQAALGVSKSSIKEARRGERFPARWFPVVEALAKAKGFVPDRRAFNWIDTEFLADCGRGKQAANAKSGESA